MKCKFYEGQRIVANRNHPDGDFKKGDEFTAIEIIRICTDWAIRIREDQSPKVCFCSHGNALTTNGKYYNQEAFDPVQEIGEMTIEEALSYVEPKKRELEKTENNK